MPATATKGPTMSRSKPRLVTIKVPEDIADQARIVAAMSNRQLGELVGDLLRPLLADMERQLLAERTRALGAEAPPPARKSRA